MEESRRKEKNVPNSHSAGLHGIGISVKPACALQASSGPYQRREWRSRWPTKEQEEGHVGHVPEMQVISHMLCVTMVRL